jgi:EAL domain-containing protein (putative c-di-GMP-specific phosphodiesterase class I)
VEGLLKAADTAMYQAKASGKNSYMFYAEKMEPAGVEFLKLETDLRGAVERGELRLEYQPQISFVTGSVVGLEALIRWHHPERGLVRPDEFIPMAEDMGLMAQISGWTLLETCREMKTLDLEGSDLQRVGVNLSPLAVSTALLDVVKQATHIYGIDPHLLELELTENVLMEGNATSIETLQALKGLGLSLAIDDFGTGYSSLSYLSHFPLDSLKIDRSFVHDFDKSRNNASLVEAIVAMADSLDLRVVAEGVETAEQFHFLHGLGVELVQGYLFSRPVPADRLGPMLRPGYFQRKIRSLPGMDETGIEMHPA